MIEEPKDRLLRCELESKDPSLSEDLRKQAESRILFWHVRYKFAPKSEAVRDSFLAFWLDLEITNSAAGLFAGRRLQKFISKFFARPDLADAMTQAGPLGDQILDEELFDAIRTYFAVCLTDPKYTSFLFNLKKLSDEQVAAKAAAGAVDHLILPLLDQDFPKRISMVQAVVNAYAEVFPLWEEQLAARVKKAGQKAVDEFNQVLQA